MSFTSVIEKRIGTLEDKVSVLMDMQKNKFSNTRQDLILKIEFVIVELEKLLEEVK